MRGFLLFLAIALSCSCSSENASTTYQQLEFTQAVIEDNMLSTDYSALVELTDSSVGAPIANNGTDNSNETEGLIAVTHAAKVLEVYLGDASQEISYIEYVEPGEESDITSSGRFIVSLCKDKNGSYYLPDIGYTLPTDSELVARAKEVKSKIAAGKLQAVAKGHDLHACE